MLLWERVVWGWRMFMGKLHGIALVSCGVCLSLDKILQRLAQEVEDSDTGATAEGLGAKSTK